MTTAPVRPNAAAVTLAPARLQTLQTLGIFCGLAAGAWLGGAEAPTKLVTTGLSPIVISLGMVIGVFLARWTVPALVQGTSSVARDLRAAPHLIVWAVLAGCLWAVANTLTIYAVRDVGLSIAFPLWNSNSLLGIFWGIVFFRELRGATPGRWMAVVGGALLMFIGAVQLALVSAMHMPAMDARRGIAAALAAGVLWGTMYIPYRKAYLTGMSPLSFVTFFTVGELGTMLALALGESGGLAALGHDLAAARHVLFWLLLGGFVWVIGDLFQQYAVKYAGITRGIPLSNTNQLWGLLWGILVFGELRAAGSGAILRVVLGSIVMAGGAGLIALASVEESEHQRWDEARARETARYGVDPGFTSARAAGSDPDATPPRRRAVDWLIALVATVILIAFGLMAAAPQIAFSGWAMTLLVVVMVAIAGACGAALWRRTRFN